MKIATAMAVACLSIAGLAAAADAQAVVRHYDLNIPKQGLDTALRDLAQQTGLQIALFSDTIDGNAVVGPVTGTQSAQDALRILLAPSGLSFKVVSEGTIAILNPKDTAPVTGATQGMKPSFGDRIRFVQVESPTDISTTDQSDSATGEMAAQTRGASLEEIVVTAQKRSERLIDVPVPVTAVSAAELVSSNQLRLQDYYTSVPGFMVAPTSKQNAQFLTVRGLTTGAGSPTVGVVIDDVPYGSVTALGGGQGVPDIDPGDLARVEVLRGPQGTLYGASSLGGLLKFVTIDPSTDAVSGRLQVGTSSVHNADDLGYNVRGSINVPLGETWAIRASGFTHLEPGYIDNPVRNIEGINEETTNGGRLTALWRPSDAVTLKLSALYQKKELDGVHSAELLPGLGDLQQSYSLDTSSETEALAYSAILTAQIGAATLTSLSGYNVNSSADRQDGTAQFGDLTELFFGVPGNVLTSSVETRKFSQEVRLAIPVGQKFEWLLGAYYTKEDTDFAVDFLAVDPATQQTVGAFLLEDFPTSYEEYSGFTNLTFHATDRFDIQVGVRASDITQKAVIIDDGVIFNTFFFSPPRPNPYVITPPDLKADAFTYLVTPQFKVTPNIMVYARLASGYRAGGVNLTTEPGIPSGFDPDETQTYEIGFKGEFLDRTLSVDASLYYIDWKDIQLFLNAPSDVGYFDNGSRAKSQGLELAVQSRPLDGLTISGWVAWNTAVLTEDLPSNSAAVGSDGDRLPYNARFSGKLSVQQHFPLTSSMDGFVGAEVSYVDERLISFLRPDQLALVGGSRPVAPAYARTDLRAGVEYDSWTVNLFVNNLTDRRGILTRAPDAGPLGSVNYIQPRTIGLSLVKTF